MTDCKSARRAESGKIECKDSSMILHVGFYCDPAKCERVRRGEIRAIEGCRVEAVVAVTNDGNINDW